MPTGEPLEAQSASEPEAAGAAAARMSELHTGLRKSAELAHSLGLSLDELMQLAWSTFVDARPGLREHLEEAQLVRQLDELRAQGRVGKA